jgi:hypothetical protein
MSVALWALSTPLTAQSAFTAGLAATLGDGWQIEGADVGLVRPLRLGPLRRWTAVGRVGSFVDQASFIGGQRGILGGVALGVRTASLTLAEIGTDPDFTRIMFDLTVEAAGYLAANSPLPHGSSWTAASLLPAIRVGDPTTTQFTMFVGPAWFLGHDSRLRVFLGLRAELPLAQGPPAP